MVQFFVNKSRKACEYSTESLITGFISEYGLCIFLQVLPALLLLEVTVKKNKRKNNGQMRCPYCGATAMLRSADGIYYDNSRNVMLYVCSNYPKCDAYVRVHPGTNKPVGTMANHALRALRNEAHRYFDRLHKEGIMSKQEAYYWLANLISAPLSEAHIGYLGEYYCTQVIEESKKLLQKKGRYKAT